MINFVITKKVCRNAVRLSRSPHYYTFGEEVMNRDDRETDQLQIVKRVEDGKAVWEFSDGSPIDPPMRRWDRLVFDNRPQQRL